MLWRKQLSSALNWELRSRGGVFSRGRAIVACGHSMGEASDRAVGQGDGGVVPGFEVRGWRRGGLPGVRGNAKAKRHQICIW